MLTPGLCANGWHSEHSGFGRGTERSSNPQCSSTREQVIALKSKQPVNCRYSQYEGTLRSTIGTNHDPYFCLRGIYQRFQQQKTKQKSEKRTPAALAFRTQPLGSTKANRKFVKKNPHSSWYYNSCSLMCPVVPRGFFCFFFLRWWQIECISCRVLVYSVYVASFKNVTHFVHGNNVL